MITPKMQTDCYELLEYAQEISGEVKEMRKSEMKGENVFRRSTQETSQEQKEGWQHQYWNIYCVRMQVQMEKKKWGGGAQLIIPSMC